MSTDTTIPINCSYAHEHRATYPNLALNREFTESDVGKIFHRTVPLWINETWEWSYVPKPSSQDFQITGVKLVKVNPDKSLQADNCIIPPEYNNGEWMEIAFDAIKAQDISCRSEFNMAMDHYIYPVPGVSLANAENINKIFVRLVPVNSNDYTFVPRFASQSELDRCCVKVLRIQFSTIVWCQQVATKEEFLLEDIYQDDRWIEIDAFRQIPGDKIQQNRHFAGLTNFK